MNRKSRFFSNSKQF